MQPKSPLDNISNLERSEALIEWEKSFERRREAAKESERSRAIDLGEQANKIRSVRFF